MKVEYFKLMVYEHQEKLFDKWIKTNDNYYYDKLMYSYKLLEVLEDEENGSI